jgi:hypothetical protein
VGEVVESSGFVDAIIELGNQRRQILVRMKEAVEQNDLETVLQCAKQLVGHNERERAEATCEQKSN